MVYVMKITIGINSRNLGKVLILLTSNHIILYYIDIGKKTFYDYSLLFLGQLDRLSEKTIFFVIQNKKKTIYKIVIHMNQNTALFYC